MKKVILSLIILLVPAIYSKKNPRSLVNNHDNLNRRASLEQSRIEQVYGDDYLDNKDSDLDYFSDSSLNSQIEIDDADNIKQLNTVETQNPDDF